MGMTGSPRTSWEGCRVRSAQRGSAQGETASAGVRAMLGEQVVQGPPGGPPEKSTVIQHGPEARALYSDSSQSVAQAPEGLGISGSQLGNPTLETLWRGCMLPLMRKLIEKREGARRSCCLTHTLREGGPGFLWQAGWGSESQGPCLGTEPVLAGQGLGSAPLQASCGGSWSCDNFAQGTSPGTHLPSRVLSIPLHSQPQGHWSTD